MRVLLSICGAANKLSSTVAIRIARELAIDMSYPCVAAEDVVSSFKNLLAKDVAVPVAAMNSLVHNPHKEKQFSIALITSNLQAKQYFRVLLIKKSKSTAWMELEHELSSYIS
jgi:hypothetical protein